MKKLQLNTRNHKDTKALYHITVLIHMSHWAHHMYYILYTSQIPKTLRRVEKPWRWLRQGNPHFTFPASAKCSKIHRYSRSQVGAISQLAKCPTNAQHTDAVGEWGQTISQRNKPGRDTVDPVKNICLYSREIYGSSYCTRGITQSLKQIWATWESTFPAKGLWLGISVVYTFQKRARFKHYWPSV